MTDEQLKSAFQQGKHTPVFKAAMFMLEESFQQDVSEAIAAGRTPMEREFYSGRALAVRTLKEEISSLASPDREVS